MRGGGCCWHADGRARPGWLREFPGGKVEPGSRPRTRWCASCMKNWAAKPPWVRRSPGDYGLSRQAHHPGRGRSPSRAGQPRGLEGQALAWAPRPGCATIRYPPADGQAGGGCPQLRRGRPPSAPGRAVPLSPFSASPRHAIPRAITYHVIGTGRRAVGRGGKLFRVDHGRCQCCIHAAVRQKGSEGRFRTSWPPRHGRAGWLMAARPHGDGSRFADRR